MLLCIDTAILYIYSQDFKLANQILGRAPGIQNQ